MVEASCGEEGNGLLPDVVAGFRKLSAKGGTSRNDPFDDGDLEIPSDAALALGRWEQQKPSPRCGHGSSAFTSNGKIKKANCVSRPITTVRRGMQRRWRVAGGTPAPPAQVDLWP